MENHRHQGGWQFTFFAIWTGQAFSLIGSKVVQFAPVWWLTERTGSATVLATATMVALVPEVMLAFLCPPSPISKKTAGDIPFPGSSWPLLYLKDHWPEPPRRSPLPETR